MYIELMQFAWELVIFLSLNRRFIGNGLDPYAYSYSTTVPGHTLYKIICQIKP